MEETDSTCTKFLRKIPGFAANSREFQTGFVEKVVDCFVPYFKQICKDPGRVTFCFQCIDHLILYIINDVL